MLLNSENLGVLGQCTTDSVRHYILYSKYKSWFIYWWFMIIIVFIKLKIGL